MDFTTEIKGHCMEFIEDSHTYLVDGVILPSITQILKVKFGGKYAYVNKATLQRASADGTRVHEAIERYCKTGEMEELEEVKNFRFLQRQYGFKVIENESPVILFKDNEPFACGRLDLVLEMDGQIGGADIKRTSTLDKQYLAYQLNLYRIAYQQCYGVEWQFLKGIHLKDNKRKFVEIPIAEDYAWDLVKEYIEEERA